MSVLLACGLSLALAGTLLASASRASSESRATTLVRAALGACAALVLPVEVLGVAGHLTPAALLASTVAICAGLAAVARRAAPDNSRLSRLPREPWTALEIGLAVALVAALATRLSHGLHRTTYLYDTLSYHLHAPATWARDARLSIVNAVFGDRAPAYAPSNVELLFWLLLAPLRSDALAQAGQVPLAALACAAIAAAVREAGGPRAAALAAALAFLYVPEVWQQAPSAMVDLGMAAFFLASLPFALRLRRSGGRGDALALGLALGLGAGSKFVGLVLALPFAAFALPSLVQRARRAGVWALGAALATGGFWYARNLVVTGNPLFPMTVALGRVRLFAGALDATDVRASDYHLPVADVGALGGMLLDAGLAFALAGAAALVLARQRRWALLAAALVALFWLAVPFQESRFLFPAFGVAAVAMALPRGVPGPWRWAPLALALAGTVVQGPTPARWGALGVGLAAAVLAASARVRPPAASARWWITVGAVLAGAGAAEVRAALQANRAHAPRYDVGDGLVTSWAWFRENIAGAHVAYTGNNLAFPLWGRELSNDVRHVNVAGGAADLLHDFAARTPQPTAPEPEPAPDRAGASYEAWRANLRAARRDVLFVAAVYPEVRRVIAADDEGFPIERVWADAHPETFTLRYADDFARVYGVAP